MTVTSLSINRRQYLELDNIATGVLAPLTGFMIEEEFNSVVETMRLLSGDVFSLPVVMDIPEDQAAPIGNASKLDFFYEGSHVGEMIPQSVFTCDKQSVAKKVFGTSDRNHPGVARFFAMGDSFVGGPVKLQKRISADFAEYDLTPEQTRAHFADGGWETVVGFQTRNVPHRAHEYLLRLGLEFADGLFVQPLVGAKKKGDYTTNAILVGYRALIADFLPKERVLLGVLSTEMRYAGPREAVFHAIIRRNYGCTHFIVGRDHAGVGDYYGLYEAHDLTRQFDGELGIEILRLHGPFYCVVCDGVVTDRSCPHLVTAPQSTKQISGTEMRSILLEDNDCPPELMRPKVVESLSGVELFLTEDSE
jgi:sulfate adenylyltransferase